MSFYISVPIHFHSPYTSLSIKDCFVRFVSVLNKLEKIYCVHYISLSKYSQIANILHKIILLIRWSKDAPFPKRQLIHRSFILKKSFPFLCKVFGKAIFFVTVFLFTVKIWAIFMLRKNNRL